MRAVSLLLVALVLGAHAANDTDDTHANYPTCAYGLPASVKRGGPRSCVLPPAADSASPMATSPSEPTAPAAPCRQQRKGDLAMYKKERETQSKETQTGNLIKKRPSQKGESVRMIRLKGGSMHRQSSQNTVLLLKKAEGWVGAQGCKNVLRGSAWNRMG